MLQTDENEDGNILNSVMESGHSVVLTGKEKLPNGNHRFCNIFVNFRHWKRSVEFRETVRAAAAADGEKNRASHTRGVFSHDQWFPQQ